MALKKCEACDHNIIPQATGFASPACGKSKPSPTTGRGIPEKLFTARCLRYLSGCVCRLIGLFISARRLIFIFSVCTFSPSRRAALV